MVRAVTNPWGGGEEGERKLRRGRSYHQGKIEREKEGRRENAFLEGEKANAPSPIPKTGYLATAHKKSWGSGKRKATRGKKEKHRDQIISVLRFKDWKASRIVGGKSEDGEGWSFAVRRSHRGGKVEVGQKSTPAARGKIRKKQACRNQW